MATNPTPVTPASPAAGGPAPSPAPSGEPDALTPERVRAAVARLVCLAMAHESGGAEGSDSAGAATLRTVVRALLDDDARVRGDILRARVLLFADRLSGTYQAIADGLEPADAARWIERDAADVDVLPADPELRRRFIAHMNISASEIRELNYASQAAMERAGRWFLNVGWRQMYNARDAAAFERDMVLDGEYDRAPPALGRLIDPRDAAEYAREAVEHALRRPARGADDE